MDDKAHIRLVDAHPEGDGGHNHVDFLCQEKILVVRPCLGVQAGVVREGLDTVDREHLGHFLHFFAAEAVDDAAFAGILPDETDDIFLRVHFVPHLVIEVGTVEGRAEHAGVLDAEVLEDVTLDLGGCRGGEGDQGRRLDLVYDGADAAVFRTEVMAPF